MEFKQLPVIYNEQGEVRKVGFELEYANVGVEETVKIIQELYGGQPEAEHRFSQKVVGTRLGDFSVELDLRLLTEKSYKQIFDKLNINLQDIKLGSTTLEDKVETALESLISKYIPYEVGTPPVPCTEIAQFEQLRQALYEHHAKGTEAFLTNAFGTHINVEVPDTSTETILRFIRSFLLLYPWLLQAGETDFARLNMTTFINPYQLDYVKLVLDPAYRPSQEQLIQDYHRLNPDRNRPLDLYPLFAALNQELLNQFSNLGKVKPRTTFHYRLPNSLVSQAGWTLAQEWNLWVVIEELANDPARIASMTQEYLQIKDDTLIGSDSKWVKQVEKWVSENNTTK